MANLSGLYIKGTGSYEVKEIAPISEVGQLFDNNTFENWTADNPDDWQISGEDSTNYVTEHASGAKIVHDGDAPSGITLKSPTSLSVGRMYLLKILVSNYTGSGGVSIREGLITLDVIAVNGYYEFMFKATGTYIRFVCTGAGDRSVVVEESSIEEVPEGYPLLDKGDTYLECTLPGTVAFPSTQAYGEWEFDWYKADSSNYSRIQFISDNLIGSSGYSLELGYRIRAKEFPAGTDFFTSPPQPFSDETWYRFKITRTLDGEFYFYIKGAEYGINEWTLIETFTGSNPKIDNTISSSSYFIIDSYSADDRIANIVMRPAVKQ